MDPAEVVAVEVKQYVGSGLKALVPRVLGQTAEEQTRKTAGPRESRQWDAGTFLQALGERRGPASADVAHKLLEWAARQQLRLSWGRGAQDGSFYVSVDHGGQPQALLSMWTYGRVEFQFETLKRRPPFEDEALRLELRDRLNAIPGVTLPADAIGRRPSVPLTQVEDPGALQQLWAALEWAVDRIKAAA
jgi:hypothetical protein